MTMVGGTGSDTAMLYGKDKFTSNKCDGYLTTTEKPELFASCKRSCDVTANTYPQPIYPWHVVTSAKCGYANF